MEKYLINPGQKLSTISKDIYGHFSEHLGRCIYDGLYVGEDSPIPNVNGMRTDLVEALRDMGIPVLRWPGGCFADLYHWRDGIGPKESRKKTINAHWGGVVEDNSLHHGSRRFHRGGIPQGQRSGNALENEILRRRQRKLGLRR